MRLGAVTAGEGAEEEASDGGRSLEVEAIRTPLTVHDDVVNSPTLDSESEEETVYPHYDRGRDIPEDS